LDGCFQNVDISTFLKSSERSNDVLMVKEMAAVMTSLIAENDHGGFVGG
jgi:hypothetical protein